MKINVADIEIKRLEADTETVKKLFPEDVLAEIQDTKPYFYVAMERFAGQVMGAAVVSLSETLPDMMQLHYLVVAEGFRKQAIGSYLMEEMCKALGKAGMRYLLYRNLGNLDRRMLNAADFATKNLFISLVRDLKVLEYPAEQVRETPLIKKTEEMADETKKIVYFKDYKDPRIQAFNQDPNHGMLAITPKTAQLRYSRFFLKKDRIVGAGMVQVTRDGFAVLQEIFLEEGTDERAWPMLLSHCLLACSKTIGVENICVRVSGDARRNAVKSVLGEPASEYNAMEMVRYL